MAETVSMEVAEEPVEPLSHAFWQGLLRKRQKFHRYFLFQELHLEGVTSHAHDFSALNFKTGS